jgi:hypothetical protein
VCAQTKWLFPRPKDLGQSLRTIPAQAQVGRSALAGASTDLTWSPDQLTLTPGFGPMEIVWTASTSGDFILNSTVSPDVIGGAPVPFSGVVSVIAGDSLSFVVMGDLGFSHPLVSGSGSPQTSGFDAQFGPLDLAQVPEPSRPIALVSIGILGLGAVIVRWRRRRASVRLLSAGLGRIRQ